MSSAASLMTSWGRWAAPASRGAPQHQAQCPPTSLLWLLSATFFFGVGDTSEWLQF